MMSSIGTRSTQNLAIPSTQNTAPIIEFRCLYTHDLRQKKKRWQDGVLRFHTFNKRIMVYDVPRNFIGDTHWREEESVQDGDELRLDKGVLIQVGESMGSTEQDLTELLKKGRLAPSTSGTEIAPRPNKSPNSSSAAGPITQLRPKSLNALLGTPRGAYGRALLPVKSPFENRQTENDQIVEEGRPAKRQRINARPEPTSAAYLTAHPSNTASLHAPPNRFPKATRLPPLTKAVSREVTSIDSDDNSLISSSPVKAAPSKNTRPPRQIPKPVSHPTQAPKPITKRSEATSPAIATLAKGATASSLDRQIAPENRHRSTVEEERPVNPLRIGGGKPRRKLMYRELLPPKPGSRPPDTTKRKSKVNGNRGSESLSTDNTTPQPNEGIEGLLRLRRKRHEHQGRSEDSETPVPTRTEEPTHKSDHTTNPLDKLNSQSLFVSQDTPAEIEAAAELARIDQSLLACSRPISTLPVNRGTGDPPPNAKALHPTTTEPNRPDLALQTIDPPNEFSNHLRQQQQRLNPPAAHPLNPQLHAAPTSNPPAPLPLYPLPPNLRRSPLRKALSESHRTNRSTLGAAPPKHSLQRTVSDTSLSRDTSLVHGPCAASGLGERIWEGVADKDIGPWSREAFDLFGWRGGDAKGATAGAKGV